MLRLPSIKTWLARSPPFRILHTPSSYDVKYADKLHRRAQENGLSLKELREKAIEERAKENKPLSRALSHPPSTQKTPSPTPKVRKDSSPVRPLSSILNVPLILSTPHTSTQISALWTTYHASRSDGTGRGYVCATVPVDLYERMVRVADKYPAFVVPVPRLEEGSETACEFYFLQWGFHDSPPIPSALDPFATPPHPSLSNNPQTSTILFTPLQEYKLRASFATPYFVVTHYTDFARTHGVVLLRGEITPSPGSAGRYILSQRDAQMLAISVQKFYIWGAGGEAEGEEAKLLKVFHEKPEEFQWEDLAKHANITA